MNDDPWMEEFEERDAGGPDEQNPPDDELAWTDAPSAADSTASFRDQLMRDVWPIRMPMALEIYAEGSLPQVHPLESGQGRRHPDSQIVTIVLEFDRARVRELMLEQIRSPRDPEESKLVDIIALARVDRVCFLEAAAAHFVDLLSETDAALRRDRYLFGFLRELHEYDADVIGDLVAKTIRANHAAGARLRDILLEVLEDPKAHDALGWLVAAAITQRLEEL